MQNVLKRIQRYISILLSISIIITSFPAEGFCRSYLAPPSEKEIIHTLETTDQSSQNISKSDYLYRFFETYTEEIKEHLRKCYDLADLIISCHQPKNIIAGISSDIEGYEVIQILKKNLFGLYIMAGNYMTFLDDLMRYIGLFEQYENSVLKKELFLKEDTDIEAYKTNVKALCTELRLIIYKLLYLQLSKKSYETFKKTEQTRETIQQKSAEKQSDQCLLYINDIASDFSQYLDYWENKISFELLRLENMHNGSISAEESRIKQESINRFRFEAQKIMNLSTKWTDYILSLSVSTDFSTFERNRAEAMQKFQDIIDQATRLMHHAASNAFRLADGRRWGNGSFIITLVLLSIYAVSAIISLIIRNSNYDFFSFSLLWIFLISCYSAVKFWLMADSIRLPDQTPIALSAIDYSGFQEILERYNMRIKNIKKRLNNKEIIQIAIEGEREAMKIELTKELTRASHHTDLSEEAIEEFVSLAVFEDFVERLSAQWILLHEKIEAQFSFLGKWAHTAGMIGLIPVVGILIIRPLGYVIQSCKPIIKQLWYTTGFAERKMRKSIIDDMWLVDRNKKIAGLTHKMLKAVDAAFYETNTYQLEKGSQLYIKLLLLEEILKNKKISKEFIKHLDEEITRPLMFIDAMIKRYYLFEDISIQMAAETPEENVLFDVKVKLIKYFVDYHEQLPVHTIQSAEKGTPYVYIPAKTPYPVYVLLIRKMVALGILDDEIYLTSILAEGDEEIEDLLIPVLNYLKDQNMFSSIERHDLKFHLINEVVSQFERGLKILFLFQTARAAYRGKIDNKELKELYIQFKNAASALSKIYREGHVIDFTKKEMLEGMLYQIQNIMYPYGEMSIIHLVLLENIEGIKKFIEKLCNDDNIRVRMSAYPTAKYLYPALYKELQAKRKAEIVTAQKRFKEYFGNKYRTALRFLGVNRKEYKTLCEYTVTESKKGDTHTLEFGNGEKLVFCTKKYVDKKQTLAHNAQFWEHLTNAYVAYNKGLSVKQRLIKLKDAQVFIIPQSPGARLSDTVTKNLDYKAIQRITAELGKTFRKLHEQGILYAGFMVEDSFYTYHAVEELYKEEIYVEQKKNELNIYLNDISYLIKNMVDDKTRELECNYVMRAFTALLEKQGLIDSLSIDPYELQCIFEDNYMNIKEDSIKISYKKLKKLFFDKDKEQTYETLKYMGLYPLQIKEDDWDTICALLKTNLKRNDMPLMIQCEILWSLYKIQNEIFYWPKQLDDIRFFLEFLEAGNNETIREIAHNILLAISEEFSYAHIDKNQISFEALQLRNVIDVKCEQYREEISGNTYMQRHVQQSKVDMRKTVKESLLYTCIVKPLLEEYGILFYSIVLNYAQTWDYKEVKSEIRKEIKNSFILGYRGLPLLFGYAMSLVSPVLGIIEAIFLSLITGKIFIYQHPKGARAPAVVVTIFSTIAIILSLMGISNYFVLFPILIHSIANIIQTIRKKPLANLPQDKDKLKKRPPDLISFNLAQDNADEKLQKRIARRQAERNKPVDFAAIAKKRNGQGDTADSQLENEVPQETSQEQRKREYEEGQKRRQEEQTLADQTASYLAFLAGQAEIPVTRDDLKTTAGGVAEQFNGAQTQSQVGYWDMEIYGNLMAEREQKKTIGKKLFIEMQNAGNNAVALKELAQKALQEAELLHIAEDQIAQWKNDIAAKYEYDVEKLKDCITWIIRLLGYEFETGAIPVGHEPVIEIKPDTEEQKKQEALRQIQEEIEKVQQKAQQIKAALPAIEKSHILMNIALKLIQNAALWGGQKQKLQHMQQNISSQYSTNVSVLKQYIEVLLGFLEKLDPVKVYQYRMSKNSAPNASVQQRKALRNIKQSP